MPSAFPPGDRDEAVVTGNTIATKPENRLFYPALDGLRAVAFLMVFFHHYLQLPWGWMGVDLFFVLSGFLITGILFDSRFDRYRVRNFYVRRTLRIMPLYYGVLIALLLSAAVVHWEWNWHWIVWPLYLGNFAPFIHPYVDGDAMQRLADFQPVGYLGHNRVMLYLGHFWSLCVEEQFYFFWPWVVFLIRDRRKLIWICAATVPICLAMRLIGQHQLPAWMLENQVLYRATPFRLDALLLGGLLSLLLRGPWKNMMVRAATILLPIALSGTLLWAILSQHGRDATASYVYPSWMFTWALTWADVLSAILIMAAIQQGSLAHRILSLPSLRWLGRISYGAYVLHDIPHPLYLHAARMMVRIASAGHGGSESYLHGPTMVTASAIALSATLILSWISFKYFESFFLGYKEKWTIRDTRAIDQPIPHLAADRG